MALAVGCSAAAAAAAQPPAATAQPSPTWTAAAVNLTRLESWQFFEPRTPGGDPDYAFVGNRLRVEMRRRWPKAELTLAAQHVAFGGLPDGASGPGPLGTGALYFDQGGRRTNAQQLYLRYANVKLPALAPGLEIQLGRMAYTSGAEAPSGVPKIEAVKRQRLDARLVGEFEWSLYQRGFDGVQVNLSRPDWQLTGMALMPTQGGFARVSGPTMTDVVVAGVTVSSRPGPPPGARTQVQGFGLYYGDHRSVTQRPDNSGLTAIAADIHLATFGSAVLGAYPADTAEVDVLGWAALQRGDWYAQGHTAFAIAGEAGIQWSHVPWKPWVRAGAFHASGDQDPRDDRHGTFFPLLPTVRRFSMTTAYSTMNLRESFVQVLARPRPSLGLRVDVRRLDLASAADLWYAGSGATLGRGNTFGYAGRRSNGSTRLGSSVEASVDLTVTPRWSVNGFLARMAAGDVVRGTFSGNRLWFAYLESVVRWDIRR
ncbi:MAG: alginate export family protein [Acidobacteriota bacterium]